VDFGSGDWKHQGIAVKGSLYMQGRGCPVVEENENTNKHREATQESRKLQSWKSTRTKIAKSKHSVLSKSPDWVKCCWGWLGESVSVRTGEPNPSKDTSAWLPTLWNNFKYFLILFHNIYRYPRYTWAQGCDQKVKILVKEIGQLGVSYCTFTSYL